MTQPRKTLRKTKNIYTWIRQRTSPFCYGIKSKAGHPVHCNRNDDVLYHFQALKVGMWGRRLSRLKNKDMSDHFSGKKTFYFTADGRSSVPEVLVNIDIDCHGSGSLEGAIAFAEHLKATQFPGLYFEASTNGNGVHGFIVVVKRNLGDEGLNSVLGWLDKWLKAELSKGVWDVEDVEVKGHCPEFTWGFGKYELKTYKSGQLAKLPREALTRAEELLGTTRIAVDELRRLKVPATKVGSIVPEPGKLRCPRPVVVEQIEREVAAVKSDASVVFKVEQTLQMSAVVETIGKTVSGSIVGRHFGDEELAKLKGGYLSLAKDLLGEKRLVATGRKVVTEGDLAVFLMLLRFFSLNMNVDGSLPTARWREMWTALFEAGDIERGWCHHRFARMRNFLSDKDLIDWQDEDFVVGVYGDDGRFIPGKAAKWRADSKFMSMFDEAEEPYVKQVTEVQAQQEKKEEGKSILYGCKVQVDERQRDNEEGRSILYGYKDHDQGIREGKEEEKSTLYGYTTRRQPIPPLLTIDNQPLLDVLNHLGIEIPLQKPRFLGYSTGQLRMAA